jgi:hypothetical protein
MSYQTAYKNCLQGKNPSPYWLKLATQVVDDYRAGKIGGRGTWLLTYVSIVVARHADESSHHMSALALSLALDHSLLPAFRAAGVAVLH